MVTKDKDFHCQQRKVTAMSSTFGFAWNYESDIIGKLNNITLAIHIPIPHKLYMVTFIFHRHTRVAASVWICGVEDVVGHIRNVNQEGMAYTIGRLSSN
jgi:hypothetical protein